MNKILLMFPLLLCACKANDDDKTVLGGDPNRVQVEAREVEEKVAGDGPFGIPFGVRVESLNAGDRDPESGVSVLNSAPKPSSQFPTVAVISYPKTGVCEVRAISADFDSDSYITSASAFVDQVAGALDSRYGKGTKVAGCTGYSCESEYKIQGIESGGAWYGYEWAAGKTPLPSNVKKINLYVTHAEFNNSSVRLDYQFNNIEACDAASKAAKAGNL